VGLTSNLEARGRSGGEAQRYRAHRPHVRRHVLAHAAIAARGRAYEDALFVVQREREPVDLELDRERYALPLRENGVEALVDPVDPSEEVVGVEGVAEREEGDGVPNLRERVERLAAHAVGG